MALVAVRITGETEQDFIDFIGHIGEGEGKFDESIGMREDAGFSYLEVAFYLLRHGYTLGLVGFTAGIKDYKAEFEDSI